MTTATPAPGPRAHALLTLSGLLAITAGGSRLETLGIHGTSPVWVDDDIFYYVAAPTGVVGPCDESRHEMPEANELRRHRLSDGRDEQMGAAVRRASRGGLAAAASASGPVAFGLDSVLLCREEELTVVLRDWDSPTDSYLGWTERNSEYDFVVGLLPSGAGFLVQTVHRDHASSSLYAVTFSGAAGPAVVPSAPGGYTESVLDGLDWYWPAWGSVRRLGPACELYGVSGEEGGSFRRISLPGGEVGEAPCPTLGPPALLMDVRQW